MLIYTTIEGITPLLQHRFQEGSELDAKTRTVQIKREDPRDAAERAALRLPGGQLYFPGAAISRLLREAGAAHKQRGSRKSLRFVIPAAVLVPDDAIPLLTPDGKKLDVFEVDSRPVTIPATKGKIMRHRARLNAWRADFALEVDTDVLDTDIVHQLLTEGGQRIGIGDFRPEKGGPFGRFRVTLWQEQHMRAAAE